MAFYNRQFATASPVLTMSPQVSHQSHLGMPGFASQCTSSGFFGAVSRAATPTTLNRSNTFSGRKRSRDEASINLDAEVPVSRPIINPRGRTFGGISHTKSSSSFSSGFSYESRPVVGERNAALAGGSHPEENHASHTLNERNCKVQRTIATNPALASSTSPFVTSAQPDTAKTLPGGPQAPVIDNFTLHLGIGWRKLSDDQHIQAAARGWARYIENHYPLSNVQIHLESKGLQSYLIESTQGYFLFAEDLRQGRLVSTTVEGALRNLRTNPPIFDGTEQLVAAETPKPSNDSKELEITMGNGMEMD